MTPANAFGFNSFDGAWDSSGVKAVTTAGQNVSQSTLKAAETEAKATTESAATLASQQKASTAAETATSATIANAWIGNVFNLFQRSGVILLGLVLIGFALWLMGQTGARRAFSKLEFA